MCSTEARIGLAGPLPQSPGSPPQIASEAMQGDDQRSTLIDPVGGLPQIMTIESGREATIEDVSHSFESTGFADGPRNLPCG